jgi:hypothetical protein
MEVFNLNADEMDEIEHKGAGTDAGTNADAANEEGGEYEELGPPRKLHVNMMRFQTEQEAGGAHDDEDSVSIKLHMIRTMETENEEHVTVLISDIIAENCTSKTAAADSATQASVLAMEHKSRCFDIKPCKGTIITATGKTAGAIKFRAKTRFLGSDIDVYLADIDCSVVAATVTCRLQNMCWTFGPGSKGKVKNFNTGQHMPLTLTDDMWPIPIECFTPRDIKITSDKPNKYNSEDIYKKKLTANKQKYNTFEVYTSKLGSSQPTEEINTHHPKSTESNSKISDRSSIKESTPVSAKPSTVLKADLPIGRKAAKPEKSCLWHGRTGHQGKEKLQFCTRCSIYRSRGLDLDPSEVDLNLSVPHVEKLPRTL